MSCIVVYQSLGDYPETFRRLDILVGHVGNYLTVSVPLTAIAELDAIGCRVHMLPSHGADRLDPLTLSLF